MMAAMRYEAAVRFLASFLRVCLLLLLMAICGAGGYVYGQMRLVNDCMAQKGFAFYSKLYLCVGPVDGYKIYDQPQPMKPPRNGDERKL